MPELRPTLAELRAGLTLPTGAKHRIVLPPLVVRVRLVREPRPAGRERSADARMNRRLSAWLSGPPPEALAALVSRLAFDHAVEMRQCTAARAASPPPPADWDGLTKLALDDLHLVLQRAGRTPAAGLRAAVGRLRTDATLLDVLAHAGPTTSLIVPAVDRFQAAVQRLAN